MRSFPIHSITTLSQQRDGKKMLFLLLGMCLSALSVFAQPFSDRLTNQQLSEWLTSPYLNVPIETATVGDMTLAFQAWKKAHPEENNPNRKHKDDDVTKFQRQLYKMQMEGNFEEAPITSEAKLQAYISHEKYRNPK
jgi:hypothetical protein